ncbi:class III lanthionine synthetase LanKC N-terminal domain-containing protein [Cupriavidus necator]
MADWIRMIEMFDYSRWSIKDIAKVSEQGGTIGRYYASDIKKDFVLFDNVSHIENEIEFSPTGWKTHISIRKADVDRALAIVLQVCDKYDLGAFKVAHPSSGNYFFGEDPGQSGKAFTLYHQGVNVRDLLQEIETRLLQAGIQPGHRVRGDRPVPGSLYSSMRNDHWPGHETEIPARVVAQMVKLNPHLDPANPFDLMDPYRNLRVVGAREPARLARAGVEMPGSRRAARAR